MSGDYRKESMPKKSAASAIINAYKTGNTPVDYVEYTAFGRRKEVEMFNQTLKLTAGGHGSLEFFVGDYGVGKTFVSALYRSLALKKGFVVMSSSLDVRNRYFNGSGNDGQEMNLYKDLIKNTAIKGENEGAFITIIDGWYEDLKENTNTGSLSEIISEFRSTTAHLRHLPMFNHVSDAIILRFQEINKGKVESQAMDFFLATYTTKADMRTEVGVKDYISKRTWFEILNTYSNMFVAAGYKGLIILIDQLDFLLQLPKIARDKNYDALLAMSNQINEGHTKHLSVALFGATTLLIDRHGIATNTPLYSRHQNSYEIKTLESEDLGGLLIKLKRIHESFFNWDSGLTEDDVNAYIDSVKGSIPMSGNCVRPISSGWMRYLDERQCDRSAVLDDIVADVRKELTIKDDPDLPALIDD